MKKYMSKNKQSGAIAYETEDDFILIRFVDGTEHLHNKERPGKLHVEKMNASAKAGKGFATY